MELIPESFREDRMATANQNQAVYNCLKISHKNVFKINNKYGVEVHTLYDKVGFLRYIQIPAINEVAY